MIYFSHCLFFRLPTQERRGNHVTTPPFVPTRVALKECSAATVTSGELLMTEPFTPTVMESARAAGPVKPVTLPTARCPVETVELAHPE